MSESILMALNVLVVLFATVAVVAMIQVRKANKVMTVVARKLLVRFDAMEQLSKASKLIDEGKLFAAIDAVGLTLDLVDDMTLGEVQGAFAVRVADLMKVVKG